MCEERFDARFRCQMMARHFFSLFSVEDLHVRLNRCRLHCFLDVGERMNICLLTILWELECCQTSLTAQLTIDLAYVQLKLLNIVNSVVFRQYEKQ